MASMLDNIDLCLFCGTPKTWDSNLRVTDNDDRLIFKCTICRECKKRYTIADMFARYSQLVEDEYAKANLETSN